MESPQSLDSPERMMILDNSAKTQIIFNDNTTQHYFVTSNAGASADVSPNRHTGELCFGMEKLLFTNQTNHNQRSQSQSAS